MDYVYGCQQQNLSYLKQLESERKMVAKGKKIKSNKKTPQKPPTASNYQHIIEIHHMLTRGLFRVCVFFFSLCV